MFNFNKCFLLASTAIVVSGCLAVNDAYASSYRVLGTHTTHLPLELEPSSLNSSPSFKLAAICALGDEECGLNIGFGNSDKDTSAGAKKCRSNGYVLTSNCAAPKVAGAKCPYHPNYSKPCSCPTSYAQTCSAPYIGVGTGCDNKFTSCQCAATYKYSCTGTGYTGGSGTKCDSKFASCSCANGYNWNGSACVANSCSGYTASTCTSPKTTSTPNCLSATTQYYASCTCPTTYKYSCSGAGYAGGTGTGCDGKYTACSCANGYNWNGSACVANSCSGYTTSNCASPKMLRTPNCLSATTQYYASCTCPASYQFSCSGTGYSGGNGSKCDAKFETCSCVKGYEWDGNTCVEPIRTVTNCQELKDVVNSSFSGDIMVKGQITCNDTSLIMKDGQNLLGEGYFGKADSEKDKISGITFNMSASYCEDAAHATPCHNIAPGSNSKISDLTIKSVRATEAWNSQYPSIIFLNQKSNVSLHNLDIVSDTTPWANRNMMGGASYWHIWIYRSIDTIKLSGINNIRSIESKNSAMAGGALYFTTGEWAAGTLVLDGNTELKIVTKSAIPSFYYCASVAQINFVLNNNAKVSVENNNNHGAAIGYVSSSKTTLNDNTSLSVRSVNSQDAALHRHHLDINSTKANVDVRARYAFCGMYTYTNNSGKTEDYKEYPMNITGIAGAKLTTNSGTFKFNSPATVKILTRGDSNQSYCTNPVDTISNPNVSRI